MELRYVILTTLRVTQETFSFVVGPWISDSRNYNCECQSVDSYIISNLIEFEDSRTVLNDFWEKFQTKLFKICYCSQKLETVTKIMKLIFFLELLTNHDEYIKNANKKN